MRIARSTMMVGSTLATALLFGCADEESIATFASNHGRPDAGPRDASGVDATRMQARGGSGGQGQGGSGGALPSGSGGRPASGGASPTGGATVDRDASERDAQDARALQDARTLRDAIGDGTTRDVALDARAPRDAQSICITDGATVDEPWSPPNICGSTLACNYTSDPCSRSQCVIGGLCIPPVTSPNGTPCDDGKPSTFSHSAKDGCPSNKCIGGANAGLPCTADTDCPGSSCFMNRCIDGPNAGSACETNADCSGGAPNANCIQQAGRKSFCDGGSEAGNFCPSRCALTGKECAVLGDPSCHRTCVGGTNPGTQCSPAGGQCLGGGVCTNNCLPVPNSPACPPAGRCVRWNADPATGTCVATDDNPRCDTVTDCPTTKYCLGDTANENSVSGISCTAQVTTDDCCLGGSDLGPCLVWDTCDTTHHVCVRTHQGGQTATCGNFPTRFVYGATMCVGGPRGSGGRACNDECRAGKCTSAYVDCR